MSDENLTRTKWLTNLIALTTAKAAERPAIWGGDFEAGELAAFFQAWDPAVRNMPWRICEWISNIAFERDATGLPADLDFLEQLRLFGPGGDLLLRRYLTLPIGDVTVHRWQWRFVGPEQVELPVGFIETAEENLFKAVQPPFRAVSYWAETGCAGLKKEARHMLLWGALRYHEENKQKVYSWHDGRVGAAQLNYPAAWVTAPERVALTYDAYLRDGNVEAVWWTGLKDSQEVVQ